MDAQALNTGGDSQEVADYAIGVLEGMMTWKDNICEALEHAGWSYTFNDITLMVIQGQLEFHEFEDCYALTQVTVFPQYKIYHFMIAGGDLQSMIATVPGFKEKAKAAGCKYLSFSGRKGFEPFLKAAGWEHKFTTMWTEVD
jgi:hypothetical protein